MSRRRRGCDHDYAAKLDTNVDFLLISISYLSLYDGFMLKK